MSANPFNILPIHEGCFEVFDAGSSIVIFQNKDSEEEIIFSASDNDELHSETFLAENSHVFKSSMPREYALAILWEHYEEYAQEWA